MDKAEYLSNRKEILQRQADFLKERPEIGRYLRIKKISLWVVAGFLCLHSAVEVCLMVMVPGYTGFDVGKVIIKLLFLLLIMFVLLNPQGSWRRILILYAYAALNFGMLVQYREGIMETIEYLRYMTQPMGTLYAVMTLLDVLFPFVLLSFTLYLTAPLKHRLIADMVVHMYRETMRELREYPLPWEKG